MLLSSLEKASEVDTAVFLKLADFMRNIIQFLKSFRRDGLAFFLADGGCFLIRGRGQWTQFGFTGRGTLPELLRGLGLEGIDLVQLDIDHFLHERLLVLFRPWCALRITTVSSDIILPQEDFQLVVVDIIPTPRRVDRVSKGFAETHGEPGETAQLDSNAMAGTQLDRQAWGSRERESLVTSQKHQLTSQLGCSRDC